MFSDFGKVLVIVGLGLTLLGSLFWVGGKLVGLGRLPGDIHYERQTEEGKFQFYFPLATCIVLSLLLTLLLNLFWRIRF